MRHARATWVMTGALSTLALSGIGCVDPSLYSAQAKNNGEALGAYHASAVATELGCGEGSLGSPSTYEFDVRLAKNGGQLQWDTGGALTTGPLSAAGAFSITASVVVDMRNEETDFGKPPCSLRRDDRIEGVLADDEAGFTGSMVFGFTPVAQADADCSDLVLGGSEVPLFAALPCTMSYALTAAKYD
jgi:hypothetical protein